MTAVKMEGLPPRPGRPLRGWGAVRLRMTLWKVAVLALILGAMGGVVRYQVQADLLATVERPLAEHDPPVILTSPSNVRSRLRDPLKLDVAAEGSLVGAKRALPPLRPRILPCDPVGGPGGARWDEPWDRSSYARSLGSRTVYSTVREPSHTTAGFTPVRVLSMPIERRGRAAARS